MLKHLPKFKLSYLVVVLLIYIPLYQKFPFLTIPGSQVSLRLEDFIIFFSVALLILTKFKPILTSSLKSSLVRSFGLFWLVGLLSVLSAIFITNTVSAPIGLLHWVRRIEYMSVFFLGFWATKSSKDVALYIKTIALVVILIFVYAVGQKYFNWPVITTQNSEYAKGIALHYVPGSHLFSTFAGHYDLASYLILVLPVFYALLLSSKNQLSKLNIFKSDKITRAYLLTICFMGLWLLVNAASRISIVSYFGSLTILFIIIRKIRYIPLLLIITLIFISMSSNLIDRYTRIFRVTLEVFAQEEEPATLRINSQTPPPAAAEIFEDRSSSIRFNVEWPRATRSLSKNPLLGTGYSSITLATDNDYLRMLGETGTIGILSFFAIVCWVCVLLFSAIKFSSQYKFDQAFLLGTASSLPGIALNMVFIDILEASKFATIFWLLLGISVSIALNYKHEQIK